MTEFSETGAVGFTTTKTYTYGNRKHAQLTQLVETNSDGTKRITRMQYPADYASGSGNSEAIALTAMKDSAHIHSPVIERWVSDSVGGTWRVVHAEITTYRLYTGRPLLWQRFILKSAGPVTNFVPSAVNGSFTRDARYLYLDNAADYDASGRLTFHTSPERPLT